jgi:hypothetical protein
VKIKRVIGGISMTLVISSLSPLAPAHAAECTPEVSTNGSLTVVAFKTVGTCTWTTPTATTSFRGLIIGGGGAGGAYLGGGGGGGGMVEFDSLTATNNELTIVVGGGGAGSSNRFAAGIVGENSSITGSSISLIAKGGAGGKTDAGSSNSYVAQSNQGSGGGSAGIFDGSSVGTQTSQSQTPQLNLINGNQYGNNGSASAANRSGGGGGASASGGALPAGFAAAGGAGRSNNILGTNYIWAGGGGGASSSSNQPGSGGSGGGAAGGAAAGWQTGSAGTGGINTATTASTSGANAGANTGGGGGGGTTNSAGGSGGSGIIILSYLRTVETVDLSLQLEGGSRSAIYRTNSTIEALVSRPGKVTFYQYGKPIAGCIRRSTTGTSPNIKASCTWKPSLRGSINLSAVFIPTNINYSSSRIDRYQVVVATRTTRR